MEVECKRGKERKIEHEVMSVICNVLNSSSGGTVQLTSPALSSSSSVLPAQSVWALNAPSMLARNSCTEALSFSGSGALFEKETMKLPC